MRDTSRDPVNRGRHSEREEFRELARECCEPLSRKELVAKIAYLLWQQEKARCERYRLLRLLRVADTQAAIGDEK